MNNLLYKGKEKTVFAVEGDASKVQVLFRDDISAFHGVKRATLPGKGKINCTVCALIFKELERAGVKTHFIEQDKEGTSLICRHAKSIPLQTFVRNCFSGSTAAMLGVADMTPTPNTIVELHLKKEALDYPLINEHLAVGLGLINYEEAKKMLDTSLKVNEILSSLFKKVGIKLIDVRLEFGRLDDGSFVLIDEISPDNMRLEEIATGERLDKDRFRYDLGHICEYYQVVLDKLNSLNS